VNDSQITVKPSGLPAALRRGAHMRADWQLRQQLTSIPFTLQTRSTCARICATVATVWLAPKIGFRLEFLANSYLGRIFQEVRMRESPSIIP